MSKDTSEWYGANGRTEEDLLLECARISKGNVPNAKRIYDFVKSGGEMQPRSKRRA